MKTDPKQLASEFLAMTHHERVTHLQQRAAWATADMLEVLGAHPAVVDAQRAIAWARATSAERARKVYESTDAQVAEMRRLYDHKLVDEAVNDARVLLRLDGDRAASDARANFERAHRQRKAG